MNLSRVMNVHGCNSYVVNLKGRIEKCFSFKQRWMLSSMNRNSTCIVHHIPPCTEIPPRNLGGSASGLLLSTLAPLFKIVSYIPYHKSEIHSPNPKSVSQLSNPIPHYTRETTYYVSPSCISSLSDRTPCICLSAASLAQSASPLSTSRPSSLFVLVSRAQRLLWQLGNRHYVTARAVGTFGDGRGAMVFSCESRDVRL